MKESQDQFDPEELDLTTLAQEYSDEDKARDLGITLKPLKFENALRGLFQTPPPLSGKKAKQRKPSKLETQRR